MNRAMKMNLSQVRLDVSIWLSLIFFTLLSVLLGHNFGLLSSTVINGSILVIAFIKTRFIIMYFMEVKRAHLLLRIIFDAWVVVVCTVLIYLLEF